MKRCPYCAEEIQDAAVICRFCNRTLATGALPAQAAPTIIVQAPPQPQWNAGVAGILSFFIPGLGQIYKGQAAAGILFLIFTGIGYLMLILPGLILHIIAIVHAVSSVPAAAVDMRLQCVDCGHVGVRGPVACPQCGHAYGTPQAVARRRTA